LAAYLDVSTTLDNFKPNIYEQNYYAINWKHNAYEIE